ncbi:uncharacterized protein Z519_12649 [Cladophialophora bantiana CBS 173.52]|uniref:Heterokaryon incompatibility domain-containing protein n=1 Tax=Cladophialophora bantiana (strain ATCC 10958 / CBS 173.52 / CDC B-1940 / NIH 8579) TaxID=1442370 RepID=A0A0D2E9C6_CLAB1|nr:uncharacterized protein Z519_12649 [Cladophialophora bantiana CBS 173.52]KIW86736.1 hypothetical protein Z519_12649 [Cladophialophora bantiana CBS 173.52]
MRRIYAQASTVYAWLGDGSKDEQEMVSSMSSVVEAFHRAESINPVRGQDALENDSGCVSVLPSPASGFWSAFGRIIHRPWFRRLWVLQEVLLAREIRLDCGPATVDWATLIKMEHIILRRNFYSLLRGKDYKIEEIFKALNIVSNFEWCKTKMPQSTDNTVPIILGLVPQRVRDAATVTPTFLLPKAYADLIQHCLRFDFRLDLLSQVEGAEAQRLVGLPSWYADFQLAAPINQFGGINGPASGFHAGFRKPFLEKPILSADSGRNILTWKGFWSTR